MQRDARVQVREDIREDRPDAAQPTPASHRRPQHRRLHDGQEQRRHQLQGQNTLIRLLYLQTFIFIRPRFVTLSRVAAAEHRVRLQCRESRVNLFWNI